MISWQVLGIDPAPVKEAVVYDGTQWTPVKPAGLRAHLEKAVARNPATLVSWDAPLSFDPSDFYDRRIDKAARAWAREHEKNSRFEAKAINARGFAGLPHWAVTCDALGMPFGKPPVGLTLATTLPDFSSPAFLAIEVHPAVALGVWWLEQTKDGGRRPPMPRYKGKGKQERDACASIAGALGFPAECQADDDHLDAYVAYRLGDLFLSGKASWVGSPEAGGYVLPGGGASEEIQTEYGRAGSEAR